MLVMNASFEPKNQDSKLRTSHNESQSAVTYPSRTIVHAKLEMTEPGDLDEREADAVANTVVSGGKIARVISGGGNSSGIAIPSQMESRLLHSQRGGQPMPQGLRSMMEGAFGQDFHQVRLHTDSEAASLSGDIHAKAFTLGNDIYFNRGQFAPETTAGQRLVAHELTHTLQQSNRISRYPYFFEKPVMPKKQIYTLEMDLQSEPSLPHVYVKFNSFEPGEESGIKASGHLSFKDLHVQITSGGSPYGDPIPSGKYEVLYMSKFWGLTYDEGRFRLDHVDGKRDDSYYGRTYFRLHKRGLGRTYGCISVTNDSDWEELSSYIRQSSKGYMVKEELPNSKEDGILKYGVLEVEDYYDKPEYLKQIMCIPRETDDGISSESVDGKETASYSEMTIPAENQNSEVSQGEEERKPSQSNSANCYVFNLEGVLLSENSTNSLENKVVVDDGFGNIITTGLNMEQFLYVTAVVQHEAATEGYAFEEMFAVARSIINATKDKGKKTEFELVKPNKQFTSVDPKKKEQHIDAYKKNSNTFLGGLRQTNQDGKFPVARKATLSAFAIKTATSTGATITTLDKEGLWEKYKNAARWDGTDFYLKLKNGGNHRKFSENKVIIIPENILDSYYTANGNKTKPRKVAHDHKLKNGIYYIKGEYGHDALIAVGNAGKSIFWEKKRGYIKDYDNASSEDFKQ